MFKNYFKLAWRNIARHKAYSFINVLGLALGICACIVIYLITSYEFSFDKFHPDRNRIYRIVGNMEKSTGENEFLNTAFSDVAGFKDQIPGFEAKAGFILYGGSISIPNGNESPKKFENRITGSYSSTAIITWPQYFDIFHYKWLAGSPQVLNDAFTVVLSEKRAKTYFGDLPLHEMIGKTVVYDDSLRVKVSGIVQDWTANTDFGYTDFISISSATHSFLKTRVPAEDRTSLSPHSAMAFVKLDKGTTPGQINSRFAAYIKDHVKLAAGEKLTMYLQPINEIHYTSTFRRSDDGDDFRKAYMPTLYILMGVAIFILVIAAVNFINLSTAQSIQRAKEIGVRKVLGSNKRSIMFQFLTETFMLTLCAVVVAVLLVKPMLYFFKDYIPEAVTFHLFDSSTLIFLSILIIITTVLAGFYPARILAGYLPVISLKGGAFQAGAEKLNHRKALIVFQFTISLIFIIGAIVMGKQISFMTKGDKGFNTDAIITINKWRDNSGKLGVLAEKIKHINGVDKVLLQGTPPMGFATMTSGYKFKGKDEIHLEPLLEIGNEDYIPFYQMKLVAGRNISHSDSLNEIVVNEALAKAIGFTNPQDAVGKMLYSMGNQAEKSFPIVGVVSDFHQGSFHDAIKPAVIGNIPNYHSIAVKLTTSEKNVAAVKTIIAQMEAKWKELYPSETV
jgi:ABC-type antimicrobial peptide transport system permease subunit